MRCCPGQLMLFSPTGLQAGGKSFLPRPACSAALPGMSRDEVLAEVSSMRWGDFKPRLTDALVRGVAGPAGLGRVAPHQCGGVEGSLRAGQPCVHCCSSWDNRCRL